MPAPVHAKATSLPVPSTPGPAHVVAPRYSIDRYLTQPLDTKPKITATYSAELRELLEEMDSKVGSEIVLASAIPRFNVVPSGNFAIDMALGGGWAENFAAMIYGYGNGGKTTTMIKAVAAMQRKYPLHKCAWCDPETTFDPDWAELHGVDLSRLLMVNAGSGEEACDIMLGLTRVPEVLGFFLDSIPTINPTKDMVDSLSDAVMATRARMLGRFSVNFLQATVIQRMNRDTLNPHGHRISWFATNSWRMKIGLVFGDPRTLPGGDWQHTFHRTKVEIKSKESMDALNGAKAAVNEETGKAKKKKGNEVSHTEHEFNVAKAKIPGTRSGEFQMIMDPDHPMGLGAIDDAGAIGAWAVRLGVLRKGGKSGSLVSDLFGFTLANREEVENKILTDSEFANWMRLACCVKQRVYLKMDPLPPDGYLVEPSVAPGLVQQRKAAAAKATIAKGGFLRRS